MPCRCSWNAATLTSSRFCECHLCRAAFVRALLAPSSPLLRTPFISPSSSTGDPEPPKRIAWSCRRVVALSRCRGLPLPAESLLTTRQGRRVQDRREHDQGQDARGDPQALQHHQRVSAGADSLLYTRASSGASPHRRFPDERSGAIAENDSPLMTPAHVRSFTAEEEEQIRKENEWAEE